MTRDIAIQTGDEDGEGAFVEYPEHYDHPEFMGVGGSGSRRHKKRKDKHKVFFCYLHFQVFYDHDVF